MSGGRKTLLKISAYGILAILFISLAITLAYFYKRENFHAILPGLYYRSAQLDAADLTRLIQQKQLKSIINLRIPEPHKFWYRREVQISAAYNVHHYDFPMRAYVLPNPPLLRQLVKLLVTVPKPVLIHCEGGADRTGLASAIVLILNNFSLQQAKQQISMHYFVISSNSVGRLVLPYYQRWLERNRMRSSRQNFMKWLMQANF